MLTTYHIPVADPHPAPKRGDLLFSNLRSKNQRTWLVVGVRALKIGPCKEWGGAAARRYKIWAERWWELEPETRVALFRSAERAGGQTAHEFFRFPQKRKAINFERYLSRS